MAKETIKMLSQPSLFVWTCLRMYSMY